MSAITRFVLPAVHHTHEQRGVDTSMKKSEQYSATYQIGNTVIHVVAPPPMTDEQVTNILKEYHRVGWSILEEMEEKKKMQEV